MFIHTHVHTHTHTQMNIHTYIYKNIHANIHTYIHRYTHTYIHTKLHSYILINIHIHMINCMYIHKYIHSCGFFLLEFSLFYLYPWPTSWTTSLLRIAQSLRQFQNCYLSKRDPLFSKPSLSKLGLIFLKPLFLQIKENKSSVFKNLCRCEGSGHTLQ